MKMSEHERETEFLKQCLHYDKSAGCQQRQRIMKEEQNRFLSLLGKPPAWLTIEQAACEPGCQPNDDS
jgi:hypothetical protein